MFYVVDPGSYDPPSSTYGGAWTLASYGESMAMSSRSIATLSGVG